MNRVEQKCHFHNLSKAMLSWNRIEFHCGTTSSRFHTEYRRAWNREKNWSAIIICFGNPRIFWLAIFPFAWPSKYFLTCQFCQFGTLNAAISRPVSIFIYIRYQLKSHSRMGYQNVRSGTKSVPTFHKYHVKEVRAHSATELGTWTG